MPAAPIGRFIEALSRSRLLDARQSEELAGLEQQHQEPRALAQEIVRRGWLTTYQINAVAKGRGDHLTLGPYVILDRLGEGGMGQLYKARQASLQRIVALKVIRPDCASNPRVVQRFQREIRAASQLVHPNVVRAYDADHIQGAYYIAMEYVDGIDLSRLVKQQGPLPVWQACDLIRQAALGLQHAFECGLVHRDIKPANLLVQCPANTAPGQAGRLAELPWASDHRPRTTDYILKITDFGLARWADDNPEYAISQLTQLGTVLGTPEYIAPEQARSSSTCDIRADLYSLGCTFYYLLAGQVPFTSGTLADKLLAHQLDQAEPVGKVRAARLAPTPRKPHETRVPRAIERVIAKLMAKDPDKRYQTPAELADALTDLQSDLARRALPVAPQARAQEQVAEQPDTVAAHDTPAGRLAPGALAAAAPVARSSVRHSRRARRGMSRPQPQSEYQKKRRVLWPWLIVALLALGSLAAVGTGIAVLAALAPRAQAAEQENGEHAPAGTQRP